MLNIKLKSIAAAFSLAFAAGAANADIVLNTVKGNTGTDNVIFNACGGGEVTGPATLLKGCLNTDHTVLVDFEGSENLFVPAGGQARIEASDGSFNTLSIFMDPANTLLTAFNALIFNVDVLNDAGDGTIDITVYETNGDVTTFLNQAVDATGENFFRLDAINGQIMQKVTFSGASLLAVEFSDVQQVRIGGTPGTPLPEPGTLALAGLALVAAARARRRG